MANYDDQYEYPNQPYGPSDIPGQPGTSCPDGYIWNGNTCEKQQSEEPAVDPTDPGNKCGPGLLPSPYDSSGRLIHPNVECVDSNEYDRRMRANIRQNPNGGEGGGQSGGDGGSGSGGGSAPSPAPTNPNFSSQSIWDRTNPLWQSLFDYSNNLTPRWNKDNVALVKGQLRSATAGNAAAEKKAYMAQRAATGQLKSGFSGRQLRGIESKGNQAYASGATGIDVRAVGENFEDQLAILDRKARDIQSYGAFQLSLAGSDQAAATIRNSMAVALAQLAQQREALQKQLDMQKYLAQLGLAGNLFGSAA